MVGNPIVIVEPDSASAACHAARLLADATADALADRGTAHLALSGGHTPIAMFESLGPLVADWRGVHIWFADDRCVPPDDPESNARSVREHLVAPGATVHAIDGRRDVAEVARDYERELGDIVLDVAVLGLGNDGHTASLFPGHAALHATGRVAPVFDSPKPPTQRITLTLVTINNARTRILLVTGSEKAAALAASMNPPSDSVPASLLDGAGMSVVCDAAAAGSLAAGS